MRKKKNIKDTRKWFRYHFFGSATLTVPKEDVAVEAPIANISLSGMGLYSPLPIGKGKKVKVEVSFLDKSGKVCEDLVEGKIDWQKKFRKIYLIGIIFNEELNTVGQPALLEHLVWLIDTFNWPQPYSDRRIATL
ncbi:MAG: PilZ domain-containing protein [Nitrospirota bacterium]